MQTEAERQLDELLSSSLILNADMLRDLPEPHGQVPGRTLRMCLEILASYTPGHFTLEDETGAFYTPLACLFWLGLADQDMPVNLDDQAEIVFEGGTFYNGKLVGTLRVCFVHQVSSPLAAFAQTSGIWDIAACIETTEAHGVLEFAIIWHE